MHCGSLSSRLLDALTRGGGTRKVNMSVAVIPMAKELGWSATDRGLVSSAFFWGCAWQSHLMGMQFLVV